jgi:hypothetical protein
MPLKIRYPKPNHKHKQKLLIVQGQCDDSANVQGVLKNKATGQVVQGQKLPSKKKNWAYKYANVAKADYTFTVTQSNSLSAAVQQSVDFSVDPVAPPPPNPPTVTSPVDNDQVETEFYPFGTCDPTLMITQCTFSDGNGNSYDALAQGTVQQPDANGDWSGTIDASTFPAGDQGCTMTVANTSGATNVNNLSLP